MRPEARINRSWWLGAVLAMVANGVFAADCDMRLSNNEVSYGELNRAEMDIGQTRAPIALGARQLARTTGSTGGGATAASAAVELRPNEGVTAIAQGQRVVGKVFSMQVEVETYIDETMT